MLHLTNLERDAIAHILAEDPEYRAMLDHQLQSVVVEKRENTGGGFLTTLSVPESTTAVVVPSPLGMNVYASVDGMEYGLGLLLFLEDGRISLLEGYSVGGEDTTVLDLERVAFSMTSKAGLRREIDR
jgi:hypothetical protein